MVMRKNVVDFSNHNDFGPGDLGRIDEVCAGLRRFSKDRPVDEDFAAETMDADAAFAMSLREDLSPRERSGWLWVAASKGHYVAVEQMSASARIRSLQFSDAGRRADARRVADAWDEMARRLVEDMVVAPYDDRNDLIDAVVDSSEGQVVVQSFGDRDTDAGRDLIKKYGALQGRALPRRSRPPLPGIFAEEFAENWPWAKEVGEGLAEVVASMREQDGTRKAMPPILLVGSKRSGIDSMVKMLARQFGAPVRTLSCGAANDAGLSAIPRGWTSSRPGFGVVAMLETGCCDPIVVLDGLGRGGESMDGLRAVLGRPDYWDACLRAQVSVGAIGIVGTTDDETRIPDDVIERFTVLRVSAPRLEDFEALVASCERGFVERNGLFAGELAPLSDAESALLREFYAATLSYDEFVHAHDRMAIARLAESSMERIIH